MFFGLVLAVESCALFLFLATDVFLFYVFFEVILIPMYFLIGGFGPGHGRTYAAAKFLIFGLLGGFVMLASVIGLYVQSARVGEPSHLLTTLSALPLGTETGRWLFVGFMFAFAIKAPLVPLHTWLPDAAEVQTWRRGDDGRGDGQDRHFRHDPVLSGLFRKPANGPPLRCWRWP